MSDLVERLLKKDAWTNQRPYWHHRNPDGPEAAARIHALETALAEAGKQLRENAETLAQVPAAIAEARRQALEEAAKACEAERLSEPQDESDAAYDRAIDHCAQAIRDMKDRT